MDIFTEEKTGNEILLIYGYNIVVSDLLLIFTTVKYLRSYNLRSA